MRALLLNPPQHCLEESIRTWTFSHTSNFPLSLIRLSRYLKDRGYQVDYLDAFNIYPNVQSSYDKVLSQENIVRYAPCGNYLQEKRTKPVYYVGLSNVEIMHYLKKLQVPDEIYISSIFTWSWETTHSCVDLCKQVFPQAKVILGGIYPSLCPQKAEESGADVIKQGSWIELENTRLDIELLQTIPLLDGVVLKTSIGCPNKCSYCAVHILEGDRFIARNSQDVCSEIRLLHKHLGIKDFYFWESNLLFKSTTHILEILDGIEDIYPQLNFQAPEGFQPNLITSEIACILKKYGFHQIRLTLETTDVERTKDSHRPTDLGHIKKAIGNLYEAGYTAKELYVVLLLGQPNQTLEMVLKDIITVYELGLKTSFLYYSPIPKTQDYQKYKSIFQEVELENLDSFLYPCANPQLTTTNLDLIRKYFDDRYIPLERIIRSNTNDKLINTVQKLIRKQM